MPLIEAVCQLPTDSQRDVLSCQPTLRGMRIRPPSSGLHNLKATKGKMPKKRLLSYLNQMCCFPRSVASFIFLSHHQNHRILRKSNRFNDPKTPLDQVNPIGLQDHESDFPAIGLCRPQLSSAITQLSATTKPYQTHT